jgi:hypothetical protein
MACKKKNCKKKSFFFLVFFSSSFFLFFFVALLMRKSGKALFVAVDSVQMVNVLVQLSERTIEKFYYFRLKKPHDEGKENIMLKETREERKAILL